MVNVYNADQVLVEEARPVPTKTFMQLTTAITGLGFNHDSSLLAVSSKYKKNALRLVHAPTMSVFPNWPTSRTPLRYAQCTAFSSDSSYLAVGTDRGDAPLFRIHHYVDAARVRSQ